jgi:hypothetical protein
VEKYPKIYILLSEFIKTSIVVLLNPVPITNELSFDPSDNNLTILFDEEPLYEVKNPVITMEPLESTDPPCVKLLNPVP